MHLPSMSRYRRKIQLKVIIDLNTKYKATTKILEENLRKNHVLGGKQDFFSRVHNAVIIKKKSHI